MASAAGTTMVVGPADGGHVDAGDAIFSSLRLCYFLDVPCSFIVGWNMLVCCGGVE